MTIEQITKQYREDRDKLRRENLKQLIAKFGSARALAIAVSRTPQQIGQLLRGEAPIGDRITKDIETKLNLPKGALDNKKHPLLPADAFDNNVNKSTSIQYYKVPIYSHVRAGVPENVGDLSFDDYVYCTSNVPGAYALRVKGDSMRPFFTEGDIVIVDPNRAPKPMDFVIAQSDLDSTGDTTLKQYYETEIDSDGRTIFQLRPLNMAYAIMNSKAQQLRIVGVVIELNKKF